MMTQDNLKYFIYVRKSSEGKERQALSHEGQLFEIGKIVEREGLTVVDTYKESKSAHIPDNRPLFNQMLKRIRRGEANGIIVWHTNRLSRNPKEAGLLQQMLQDEVIKSIVVPYRHFRSADNALLFSIEASEANQYSRDLKVSVKRGLCQKVALGQPPGVAKLGYLNTKRAEHGSNSIIVDSDRWHLIRKAFDWLLSREYTVPQIVEKLNNEHHFRTRPSKNRVGRPLHKSVLYRMFTDPFYSGYFYYTGTLHKGTYKPMITVEEFDQVQEILGRKGKPRPHKHEFAFTGLMKCGVCGCAITASKKLKQIKATGEYKTYTFYHCTKRKGKDICTDKHYTTESEMERLIEKELLKCNLIPKWKMWAIETIREDYEEELVKQNELLKSTCEYERKLLSELDALLDMRIANEIGEIKYMHKKAEREAQLMKVQAKRKRLETNIDDWIEQVNEKLNFTENISERFKTDEPKLQKIICMDFGWNWVLQEKNLIFSRHEWFSSVEELKSHYEQENKRLEPINTFEEYKRTPSYEVGRLILRRMCDQIRTEKQGE